MAFKHTDIIDSFENVTIKKGDGVNGMVYSFTDEHGSDYLEIFVLDFDENGNELRILHDNFPNQRRFFSTNIPFIDINDFERMFERMKIKLPKRKET